MDGVPSAASRTVRFCEPAGWNRCLLFPFLPWLHLLLKLSPSKILSPGAAFITLRIGHSEALGVVLEILHRPFVFLSFFAAIEGPQVTASAGSWVLLA